MKESILRWSLFLIVLSIWPNAVTISLGVFLIIARAIMVTAGMDILSLKAKHTINKLFLHNIEELIAYPLGAFTNAVKKLFQRTSSLTGEINSWKLTYSHLDPLSHPRTIVSYLLVTAALGYQGYMTWITSNPSVGINLALLPQVLWIGKILMTIPSGTLPRIPILYTLLG